VDLQPLTKNAHITHRQLVEFPIILLHFIVFDIAAYHTCRADHGGMGWMPSHLLVYSERWVPMSAAQRIYNQSPIYLQQMVNTGNSENLMITKILQIHHHSNKKFSQAKLFQPSRWQCRLDLLCRYVEVLFLLFPNQDSLNSFFTNINSVSIMFLGLVWQSHVYSESSTLNHYNLRFPSTFPSAPIDRIRYIQPVESTDIYRQLSQRTCFLVKNIMLAFKNNIYTLAWKTWIF